MDQRDAHSPKKSIQIICPAHNEELSLNHFYERYRRVRDELCGKYELVLTFINNASTDGTLSIIKSIRERDPNVQVISHARNFGYQASVLCGLTNLVGDAYVIIDADCEDPPDLIPAFIAKWEEGYDLVYGRRKWRPENAIVVAGRRLFYRLTNKIADSDFIVDMAEFSLFSKRVREQVLSHRSTFPFVRSDLAYAGFRRFGIDYKREPRRFGKTHYNFIRMAKFAIGGILSASTFPLRAIAYAGFPIMTVDLIASATAAFGVGVPFTSLALINMAFVCSSLAFLAVYIARITKDVAARPIFVVDVGNSELNRPLVSTQSLHSRISKDLS